METHKIRSLRDHKRKKVALQLVPMALTLPPRAAALFVMTPTRSVFLVSDLMTAKQYEEVLERAAAAALAGRTVLMLRWEEIRTPPHHPIAIT